MNATDIKRMQANPILDSTTKSYGTTAATSVLEFKMRQPQLAKKEVRPAICYAIDRQFIVNNILYGFGKPAVAPLSSVFAASGWCTDEVRHCGVPDRIEIANKLMDDATRELDHAMLPTLPLVRVGHDAAVRPVAVSRNGALLASASTHGAEAQVATKLEAAGQCLTCQAAATADLALDA